MEWKEAFCVSCDKPTEFIVSGWGICKKCRDRPEYNFDALYAAVPSREGRDYIKRTVKRHLPKGGSRE
jgi:hypothetical protein